MFFNHLRWMCFFLINLSLARRIYTPRYCDYSQASSGRVFPPAKMNGFKRNLAGRDYVSKGTHKKIWAPIACVAPSQAAKPRLFLSAHMSPVRLIPSFRTEKTADVGVESRDPTANVCPSSKIPDFLRIGGGRIEKVRFSWFFGWVFCWSAT